MKDRCRCKTFFIRLPVWHVSRLYGMKQQVCFSSSENIFPFRCNVKNRLSFRVHASNFFLGSYIHTKKHPQALPRKGNFAGVKKNDALFIMLDLLFPNSCFLTVLSFSGVQKEQMIWDNPLRTKMRLCAMCGKMRDPSKEVEKAAKPTPIDLTRS